MSIRFGYDNPGRFLKSINHIKSLSGYKLGEQRTILVSAGYREKDYYLDTTNYTDYIISDLNRPYLHMYWAGGSIFYSAFYRVSALSAFTQAADSYLLSLRVNPGEGINKKYGSVALLLSKINGYRFKSPDNHLNNSLLVPSPPDMFITVGDKGSFTPGLTYYEEAEYLGRSDKLFNLFRGELDFIAILDIYMSDDEIESVLNGNIPIYDEYKDNLLDLWDFQGDIRNPYEYHSLITGETLFAPVFPPIVTGESPLPISRKAQRRILGGYRDPNNTIFNHLFTWNIGVEEQLDIDKVLCNNVDLVISVSKAKIVQSGLEIIHVSTGELNVIGQNSAPLFEGMYTADIQTEDISISTSQSKPVYEGKYVLGCIVSNVDINAKECTIIGEGEYHVSVVYDDLLIDTCTTEILEQGMYLVDVDTVPVDITPKNSLLDANGSYIVYADIAQIDIDTQESSVIDEGMYAVDVGYADIEAHGYNSNIFQEGEMILSVDVGDIDVSAKNCIVKEDGKYTVDVNTDNTPIESYNAHCVYNGSLVINTIPYNIDVGQKDSLVRDTVIVKCIYQSLDINTFNANISGLGEYYINVNVEDIDIAGYRANTIESGKDIISINTGVIEIDRTLTTFKESISTKYSYDILDAYQSEYQEQLFTLLNVDTTEADISSTQADIVSNGMYVVDCVAEVIDLQSYRSRNTDITTVNKDTIDISTEECSIIEFPYYLPKCNSVDIDIESRECLIIDPKSPIFKWGGEVLLYEGNTVILLKK